MSPERRPEYDYSPAVDLSDHITERLALLLNRDAAWIDRMDAASDFRRAAEGMPFDFDRNVIDDEVETVPAEWLEPRVVEALITVGGSADEVFSLAEETWEALAHIWLDAGAVDHTQLSRLTTEGQAWVREYLDGFPRPSLFVQPK